MIAPFPKMGLCTNNSRTRIAFLGYSGIVKFVQMREIIYSPQTQFSCLPSLPVLPVIARSMWRIQRGMIRISLLLFSLPKCPDFCWCNVLEAEVKGKQRADGNHAALCSFVHMGHSRSLHFSETNPKKMMTSDMVSQQGWGKKKQNEETELCLTQEILSLSCLVPISPQSCALPQFICQLFRTPRPHKLWSKCCGCHPSCCFQFARSFRLWGASC